ncbi:hypothetical protein N665_0896s0009 [Sinapis alba]|nr:hypothetical protein N665_0896s0009 [Sinapis alba]
MPVESYGASRGDGRTSLGDVLLTCVTSDHDTCKDKNCSDLVDMIANSIDWSAFASELVSFRLLRDGFSGFRIYYIPRAKNLKADSLAKEVMSSGVLISHVDQTRPDRAPF